MTQECNHCLGPMGTMTTIGVDRDYYYRKCFACGQEEALPRAGKTYTGYSLEAETIRDFERREYAKDLLQAWEPGGKPNELFEDAYGDPIKRGKSKKGAKVEDTLIKKARQKMKERAGKA